MIFLKVLERREIVVGGAMGCHGGAMGVLWGCYGKCYGKCYKGAIKRFWGAMGVQWRCYAGAMVSAMGDMGVLWGCYGGALGGAMEVLSSAIGVLPSQTPATPCKPLRILTNLCEPLQTPANPSSPLISIQPRILRASPCVPRATLKSIKNSLMLRPC